ncbi:MAG: carboxypeptidase-like regulatory domain-containing protein, partial [Prevotellaceae bacterium]|nr:carboxypeptidase-like regulatory domain-containing protein [Prevotellaceae bacterium]
MKAKIFTLLVSLISVMSLSAQSLRLSGRVMDAKSEPVAYANVALERLDSTFVTGSTTNEKGRFTVTVPQVGDYLLQVS